MQYQLLESLIQTVSGSSSDGKEYVSVPKELFQTLLMAALKAKNLYDEEYYVSANDDVKAAIRTKKISSGAEHYYMTGYMEGRMPKHFLVDEKYYISNNPDVADAIKKGVVKTAQEHFEHRGFREGRAPFANFSLF